MKQRKVQKIQGIFFFQRKQRIDVILVGTKNQKRSMICARFYTRYLARKSERKERRERERERGRGEGLKNDREECRLDFVELVCALEEEKEDKEEGEHKQARDTICLCEGGGCRSGPRWEDCSAAC
jgi:hypothetical protein